MDNKTKRGKFSGSFGFIIASAASAIGLGNIWRFPYLAAKDGGGVFLVVYIILVVTFGFTMLTTEISIGRKTRNGPLTAYARINKNWGFLGGLAWIVPVLILPYYCAIGGWVLKYLSMFVTGKGYSSAADGFFTGFITTDVEPVIWFIVFFALTSFVVIAGVEKGIENFSKILLPILLVLIIIIAIFSLTVSHEADGVVRTGLDGLKVYIIPDFSGMTVSSFLSVVMDAMGQLFFSISVAMGIMVAYGSYMPKGASLPGATNKIEIFDTAVAFLAGLMIIPAVFVFMGTEGMNAGPGLVFITLPKVFESMGGFIGNFVGAVFFIVLAFAAITSSVSVMEAIVSGLLDKFHLTRKKASVIVTVYTLIVGTIVCLGYTNLYFELKFPNGSIGQILDVLDYISNSIFMPILAFLTCILIGWVVKPDTIIDEVKQNGEKFGREKMYVVMVKYVAPILLALLLIRSFIPS